MPKNAPWLFVFCIALLGVFLPSYTKMQELKAKNAEYARRIEVLQKRSEDLEVEQRLLETDPVYLEKVARRKMGLIREGERVYHLVPQAAGVQQVPDEHRRIPGEQPVR